MKTYSIYCLRCKTTGKRYIGLSCKPEQRMEIHRISKYIIGRAIRKYGWENFEKQILETGLTLEQANKQERFYIKEYDCIRPNGYNLCIGGEGCKGYKHTSEIRARISKGHIGKKRSIETCIKISESMTGKTLSVETRAKISRNNGARRPEVAAKISKAHTGMKYKKKVSI